MANWTASIVWTTGHGENTSTLTYGTTRKAAAQAIAKAKRMLQRNGARVLRTALFTTRA